MKTWREWFRRRTSLIILMCGAFLVGLVVARYGVRVPIWLGFVLLAVGLAVRRNIAVRVMLFCTAALLLGLSRGGAYYDNLRPYRDYAKQPVILQAQVAADAIYADNGQLSFSVKNVHFTEPVQQSVPGQVNIKGYGELALYKGDLVELKGKLYPTRGSAQATMSYAKIQRTGGQQTWLDDLRRRFAAGVQTALPEPIASFGLGLLIGQRNTLPDDISQSLKMVGLTHIIAVSGYNLTILLSGARQLLGKKSKLLTATVAIVLMLVFVGFTGASASIIRAVVVSVLGLAAWYVGRNPRPMVILLLAAALTAGWNPVYIWSDIGWYLSFLAFFGILVVAPQFLRRVWKTRKPPLLATMTTETLAAEIMTIPLIMMIFGQLSLVGLLANILVAAFIPAAMALSFIAGLVGMIAPLGVGWAAWPARILLGYMLDVALLLSRIPNSFLEGTYISVAQMVFLYGVIIATTAILYRPCRSHWLRRLENVDRADEGLR